MDRLIRAAVLGTGWIAHEHVLALSGIPGVKVVGVASSSIGRAQRFAAEHDLSVAVAPHAELVRRPDVDVVHVCTRTALHAQLCVAALEAGKHVIAEKPLAASSEETARLVTLTQRFPNLVTACNYNYRAYPIVQQARQLVAAGELGDLLFVHGGYTQDWLLSPSDYNWRLDRSESGASGAFADIGSHWFDLVEHVSGDRIEQLFAYLHTALPERMVEGGLSPVSIELDDCGVAGFRFEGGAVGTVAVSQVSAGHKNNLWFELDGSKGSLAWSQEDPDQLWLGRQHGPNQSWRRGPEVTSEDALPAGHPFGWRDAFRRNIASIYRRIESPDDDPQVPVPVAGFLDGHRGLLLVEAVVRSSTHGGGAKLPTDGKAPRDTWGAPSTTPVAD